MYVTELDQARRQCDSVYIPLVNVTYYLKIALDTVVATLYQCDASADSFPFHHVGFKEARMKRAAILLATALFPVMLPAQNSTSATQSNAIPAAADQTQFISYWTTETGWHSELQLRNNLVDHELTVAPALRLADGTETVLAPITIKPQEVLSIDLEAAIGSTAPQLIGTYGSVVLRYHSMGYRNLYAALMVHNLGHPFAFHIDATGESPVLQSGGREGIWWLPTKTAGDYLILTNQGNNNVPVDVSIYDASGKKASRMLILGPRETIRYSVRSLVTSGGLSGTYGGITVWAKAHAGSLDSLHFIFDETAAFSAILKMFDHDPDANIEERDFDKSAAWTLRAPMLALSTPDPALAFPPGTTLQPQLFVRNTTQNAVSATLRFNWRRGSNTGTAHGPALNLRPLETLRFDVAALQSSGVIPKDANWTSVILTSKSKPDDILAVAASYDSTLQYGAQTPFSDQLSYKWEGGMWEYDPYHDSIITAGNGSTKPTQTAFTIFYNHGADKYEIEQTLKPDEQMWIDVGEIIREQAPDKNGKVLPAQLTSGSYEFRDLTDPAGSLFEGKVTYDKTYGHVAYGCANCCGYYTPALTFNPLGIPFGDGAQNGVLAVDNCGAGYINVSGSFYNNWSTANSGIATVDASGYHTAVAMGATSSVTSGSLPLAGLRFTCPLRQFAPGGGDNVHVMVTFYNSPIVPLGKPIPITVTVSPSNNTAPITLAITTTSGTGSATFINNSTTMTITATTTVTVVGVTGSSVPNNIKLAAKISSGELSNTTFTVTNPVVGAIPVNFRQTSSSVIGDSLHFEYNWDSSSGNKADLTNCQIQEYVTYVGPNPFPWPSPPYLPQQVTVWPVTGTVIQATALTGLQDNNGHAAGWRKPYVYKVVSSDQVFQFQCSTYKPGVWTPLMPLNGAIPIDRTVALFNFGPSEYWQYSITKSGKSASATLP